MELFHLGDMLMHEINQFWKCNKDMNFRDDRRKDSTRKIKRRDENFRERDDFKLKVKDK